MNHIKRGVAAGAALLMALTACSAENASQDGNPTDGGGGTDVGEQITLTVWESLEGRSDFIEQAGEAFSEIHPNITIKYENVELGDAQNQIALDGPGGVGPDVFAAPSNATGELMTAGHILPIRDADALREQLVEGALKSVTLEDTLYGVPVTVDTYALFYNKEFIPEPPATWEEVIEFSRGFNEANPGKYGFVFNPVVYYVAPFIFEAPDNLIFGPEGIDPATPNTNTPSAVAGLEEFVKLREILDVPAADLDVASVDSLFEGGQAAMHLSGSWNIPVFDAAGLDYAVAPLPARAGSDTPSGSFLNSRTMYVSAYTEHDQAAQDFAAFLASPEMLLLAHEITGSIPSADIEIDSAPSLALVEQAEYAFASPSIPEAGPMWAAMDSAVANIWNGADIQSELDAATEVILNQ